MIAVKVHQSYRTVVALCDSSLIGKRLEEGKRELHVRESFFKEKEIDFDQAVKLISIQAREDATFNIVGHDAIKAALEAGLIDNESIATIQNVPFTLVLL
jgi:hypothetical protein